MNEEIRKKATDALHLFIGNDKEFRDGQYEAIEATLTNRRTLVVQRTGWGKSMVYFICTKILRDEGKGTTLIVSPLLSLMDNQIKSAKKAGLKSKVLNSSIKKEEREQILTDLQNDEIDMILTTPETLFREEVQKTLINSKIGLFVVDEAHCISDWGHDFRLEYCKINKLISGMMSNVPILATTATANDRVVDDLKEQFGGDVYISRGPLMRDNLSIQILKMKDKASRYAWILEKVPKLEGSGIIYCLTQDDCDELAGFLKKNSILVRSYHSGIDNEQNMISEKLFMNDEIKVIVATVKLGMGYDKSNISFVIHYQSPANIVAYYQQIGRAGRNIPKAYTFLMYGEEDLDIHNYFIETAFPSKYESQSVINQINYHNGIGLCSILDKINISKSRLEKTLSFLENEGYIYKEKSKYYASAVKFEYNEAHYNEIKQIRHSERDQIIELMTTDKCLSRFVVNCLDDKTQKNCGICSNCLGRNIITSEVSMENLVAAQKYLNEFIMKIEPRKQWGDRTKINMLNEEGICLSRYGHQGYGKMVCDNKYNDNKYCDELLEKSAEILIPFIQKNNIEYMAYVPSLRSTIVKDFAERLSERLNIPIKDILEKTTAKPQKDMENSQFQCNNAKNSFRIKKNEVINGRILLIDDIVDSRWTLTVCGYLLRQAGADQVFPFTLACSSRKDNSSL